MADLIDDIEVELTDKPPEAPKVEIEQPKPEPKTAERKEVTPEEGIEALKTKLAEERAARAEFDRRAAQAQAEVRTARGEVQDSNLTLLTNAISNCEQTRDVLKANIRDASAAGDWDAVAEAQAAMSDNAANLLQLRQGKTALETQPAPQVQQTQADPVEYVAQQLSPRSADWVRRHPEFARDQQLFNDMAAADRIVRRKGIAADTDEYFEAVESALGLRTDVQSHTEVEPTRSPPAAPVTRSTSTNGSRPGVVRLSPAEVEAAEMCGQTLEEYAAAKVQIEKERKDGFH